MWAGDVFFFSPEVKRITSCQFLVQALERAASLQTLTDGEKTCQQERAIRILSWKRSDGPIMNLHELAMCLVKCTYSGNKDGFVCK